MHNTQPWRFPVRDAGRTIELRADSAQQLPYSDPSGRAAHIACGAALFNLRLAAAVAGQGADVRLLPDPREPLPLATVQLAGPYRAAPAQSELHAAIDPRQTNRPLARVCPGHGPFSQVPASGVTSRCDARPPRAGGGCAIRLVPVQAKRQAH